MSLLIVRIIKCSTYESNDGSLEFYFRFKPDLHAYFNASCGVLADFELFIILTTFYLML